MRNPYSDFKWEALSYKNKIVNIIYQAIGFTATFGRTYEVSWIA